MLWEAVKKRAEEGLDALKEGVSVFVAEAEKQSKIIKKRVELSSVQNNLHKAYIRLGTHVYDLHVRGHAGIWPKDELKEFFAQIEDLKARATEIELEIETIRKEEEKSASAEAPLHMGG